MNLERHQCAISGETDLEHLHTFPQFPIFMGCVDQPPEEDIKEDMSWWISRSSGVIQLKNLIPLEVLYPESHGAGVVGALWEKHHREFARFIHKYSPKAVFEIGGAHGILEKEYRALQKLPWTILEPNPHPIHDSQAHFIKGFFNDKFKFTKSFDVVVHSHVLEHIYEPQAFMKQLMHFLEEGKRLIFSLPNMQAMLERKYTNCLNFEHSIYLTEPYVEYLLSRYGFRLIEKEYFLEDHSIFFSAVRDTNARPLPLPHLYEANKKTYMNFRRYHEELILELNHKIQNATCPVYLFGAHIFAQYLIAFGLHTQKIISLLDNDKKKQGRRLYGTGLYVQAPNVLSDEKDPLVILKAGAYNKEIKDDILKNINPKTQFLE